MHMRVREDGTEAEDPNLIQLANILFEGQELYILYLTKPCYRQGHIFPLRLCCIFSISSQVAGAKEVCNFSDLRLFPLSQCHYCFLANDWHCLKKQHLVVEGRVVTGYLGL